MALLQKLFTDALDRMSPEERKKTLEELNIGDLAGMGPGAVAAAIAAGRFAGFAAYKMALIVANAIARAVLGRGLPLVVNAALTRTMGVMLGPVGWVLTGVWTLADLASPAYRVTVPCVVQISRSRSFTVPTLILSKLQNGASSPLCSSSNSANLVLTASSSACNAFSTACSLAK